MSALDSSSTPPVVSADVVRAYDTWASSYDADRNLTRDLDADVVRGAPLVLEGRDVLELGCGTGKNTTFLAELARSVTALDFSPGMLERARERVRAPHVRFVQQDVRERWPVPDESIDVVVGNLVLEHVAELAPIFAQAARVLRPAGRLWLCELHPERQRRGGQAQYTDPRTGERVRVDAYLHSASEYINEGIRAGLELRELGEWVEEGAPAEAPPRLLSVLFVRPGTRQGIPG